MIDFPASPTTGQLFYATNGVTYRWNGTLWLSEPSLGTGYGPTGDFCATQTGVTTTGPANTWQTLMPPSIISGNVGSWYVPGTGVYRPPPGRYFIIGNFSSYYAPGAMNFAGQLRKNGVAVTINYMTSGAANWQAEITCQMTIDANGTDTFDFQGQCIGAVGNFNSVMFLAYPIAGAKGPPGDKGAPGVPASSNVWRQIARIVPTAGQTPIDITNIPVDINDIELRYDLTPTVNNAFLYMQMFDGAGALMTGATYPYFADYTYNNAAQGTNVTAYNGSSATVIPLNLNSAGWGVSSTYFIQGNVKVNNIRDATRGKSFQCDCVQVESTNVHYGFIKGGGVQSVPAALTGLRLYWSSGGSAARGAVSLYGSP